MFRRRRRVFSELLFFKTAKNKNGAGSSIKVPVPQPSIQSVFRADWTVNDVISDMELARLLNPEGTPTPSDSGTGTTITEASTAATSVDQLDPNNNENETIAVTLSDIEEFAGQPLQNFSSLQRASSLFPLSKLRSKHKPSSEAIKRTISSQSYASDSESEIKSVSTIGSGVKPSEVIKRRRYQSSGRGSRNEIKSRSSRSGVGKTKPIPADDLRNSSKSNMVVSKPSETEICAESNNNNDGDEVDEPTDKVISDARNARQDAAGGPGPIPHGRWPQTFWPIPFRRLLRSAIYAASIPLPPSRNKKCLPSMYIRGPIPLAEH